MKGSLVGELVFFVDWSSRSFFERDNVESKLVRGFEGVLAGSVVILTGDTTTLRALSLYDLHLKR